MCFGLVITMLCSAAFFVLAGPLLSYWNEAAFAGYADYVWMYALASGILSLIEIVAHVEMARQRFRSLAWMVVLSLAMCGVLYARGSRWDLGHVIGAVLLTRMAILAGMLWTNWKWPLDSSASAANAMEHPDAKSVTVG